MCCIEGDAEVLPRVVEQFGAHLGEEFDLMVADSPDEAPTISEATVPESVFSTVRPQVHCSKCNHCSSGNSYWRGCGSH